MVEKQKIKAQLIFLGLFFSRHELKISSFSKIV
jgi:hypothetical protein